MQKTIHANKRRILAILLCIAVIAGCLPFSAQEAYAASGTVNYKKGAVLEYGSHWTNFMYVDGSTKNVAYCADPTKASPDEGSHTYELLAKDSAYRKALYYMPGGYGYDKVMKGKCFSGWSENEAYVVGHLLVSYIHDGYKMSGDAFTGATAKYIEKTKEVVNELKKLPAPPVAYKAFIIKSGTYQDIVGSWYMEPMGWLELNKSSSNASVSDGNPNYTLKGAKYGVYQDGKLITTLTTDENGYAKSGKLEEGSYTVKEVKASAGYAIDVTSYDVHVVTEQTTSIKVKEVPQNNPMDLVLEKIDTETKKYEPQGKAALEGAKFKVEFYAVNSEPRAAKQPDRTWIFKTDAEGRIRFDDAPFVSGDDFYYQNDGTTVCLPLGKVVITETKAPEGYLPFEESLTVWIPSEGTAESVKTYHAPIAPEQVKRGDLDFVKVSDGDLNRLAGIPFKITSLTTGESHIIVTDANGYASTAASWNPHTQNTNAGKTSEDGIWFGEAEPNNEKGALIYDDYEIEELRCEANEGMTLIKVKVSVYKDAVTVPLGTMTDDYIEIKTTAKDEASDSQLGKAEETVAIVDTVEYKGLKKGEDYLLIGTLMNKETGKPIENDGKPVTVEKTFTAKKAEGTVEVEFKVDSALLKGKAVVVFEELYQDDVKLAVHADIEDDGQTVYYPEIGTTAKDKDTETAYSIIGKEVTIVDTVHYEGLKAGKTYKLVGTIMDKETGKPLKNGEKEVTVTKEFTAETINGDVAVEFTFDSSELSGKDIVVFETLYRGDKEIAVHADLENQGQTIHFPEIGTTASDDSDRDKELENKGEVTIKDTVEYKNLVPGKAYLLKGILMDKEIGKPLKVGGEEITSEMEFTAENDSGTVEVTFTFDAEGLSGKEIVVFEKVFYADSDIQVAVHEDIDDEGQTVKVKPEEEKEETPPVFTDTPKTGDDSNVILWVVLLLAAGAGITAMKIRTRLKAEKSDGSTEENE